MVKRILITTLFLLLFSLAAHAACSGSGTSWNCPAGSSTSDVSAAINSATDGATITFAAGSYTWSSQIGFSLTKGVTLICATPPNAIGAATVNPCTINASNSVLGSNQYSVNNTHFYRISGFTFNAPSGGQTIWFCSGGNCHGIFTQVRIDHNTFTYGTSGIAIFFGENASVTYSFGVIDHNAVTCTSGCAILMVIGTLNSSPIASELGTANNMFVEDNTITWTGQLTASNSGQGCMDSWGSAAIVWRHNTNTNCLVTAHGVTHAGGPDNIELYNNKLVLNNTDSNFTSGYRMFHHQGSNTFIAFNNSFSALSGHNGAAMDMAHYCSFPNCVDGGGATGLKQCDGTQSVDGNRAPTATYQGYPCYRQPGRDTHANYVPMYVWNNTWNDNGSMVTLNLGDFGTAPDYFPNHMQANRESFDAVSASAQTSPTSPFNGTTGMGFGTFANRPDTCTTSSETAFGHGAAGVGYFATDVGAQGTLYTCSATNTWTVFYTPYTYPHPLVSGGAAGAPSPPKNLAATVQ